MRAQYVDYLLAGLEVEVSRRLVGKDNRRVVGHRPGYGHALLLSAGKLRRPVVEAMPEAHLLEKRRRRARSASCVAAPAKVIGSITFSSAVITGMMLKVWKM